MNREERRKFKKNLKKNPAKVLKDASRFINLNKDTPLFEGDLVKLNYEKIISYPKYEEITREEYRDFVEFHKEDTFTVEYDPIRKRDNLNSVNYIVQLKEDTTSPKFLFSNVDLILVKRKEVPQDNKLEEHLSNVMNAFKESESE